MKRNIWIIFVLTTTLFLPTNASAKFELPRVFGDDMVVQRNNPVKVWGWGNSGSQVTVRFNGQNRTCTVGDDGKWLLTLESMEANSNPQTLKVSSGKESIVFKNVVIGDVWLCSGQSNMEASASGPVNSDLDMPLANYPNIRCLTLPLRSGPEPHENFPIEKRNPFYEELKGVWRVTTPDTAVDFPAVGYHFARLVHEFTDVPIGLIDNSWGGSTVETWISRDTLETIPEAKPLLENAAAKVEAYDYKAILKRKMEDWKKKVARAKEAGREAPPKPEVSKTYVYNQRFPGGCFNGLIEPIKDYAIKGAIFYQGINNVVGRTGRPNLYHETFPALIPDWRKAFGDDDMPFCIVQMTSFGYPTTDEDIERAVWHKSSGIREAQSNAHFMHDNTGLVCTYDLGHIQMHSPYKRPIGERAARWALADVYDVDGMEYNLPVLASTEKNGDEIVMEFSKNSYPSSRYGMRVPPKGFVIAGEDRHFYPAEVHAVKPGVYAASSPFVEDPVAVRYAWGVHPVADFGNKLSPAVPFRTDDWPCWIDGRYQFVENPKNPNADEIPSRKELEKQSWQRRAAQARKTLREYQQWKQNNQK